MDPQVNPDQIVAINRYKGSRLASGASPSPFQQIQSSYKSHNPQLRREDRESGKATSEISKFKTNKSVVPENAGVNVRAQKVARISTEGATIGRAIVEAENSLEVEVNLSLPIIGFIFLHFFSVFSTKCFLCSMFWGSYLLIFIEFVYF